MPLLIQDVFSTSSSSTSGSPTTCGSAMLSSYRAPYSASVVSSLERAGAVVLGKTNLDEFAMGSGGTDSVFGPSRSLWRSGIEYELADQEDRPIVQGVQTGPMPIEGGCYSVQILLFLDGRSQFLPAAKPSGL